MASVHTNPDGSRYRWDGQQWVPLPPEPKRSRGQVLTIVIVALAVVTAAMVTVTSRAVWQRVTSGPAPTSARSGSGHGSSTTARDGDGTPTPAPDGEAALADHSFFVDWLPDLRTAKAPSWVHQGTRITYYAAAASVPQSYHRYVEDEEGQWIDPTTGDKYRREDIQSAAGHGYNEVNVTVLNDSVAALDIRAYGLTDLDRSSPVTTLTWGGAVGLPGAGSDYWLAPEVLADVQETVTDDLKVVRMPYAIGDTTYSSLWIQSLSDRGNFTWVYDLDSGILLHTASATQGPPITGPVAQGEGRDGSTFLTGSTLVARRQLSLPWVDGNAPSWIGSATHFDYQGTVATGYPGTSPVVLDASLAIDSTASGTDWARYRFARTLYSTVAPSSTEGLERIDGPGQVGGVWLPPEALGSLQVGDELDHDPVTNVDVSVADVSSTDDGFTVTIRESGQGEQSEITYDGQTGLMVASSYQDLHLFTRSDLRLASGLP